MAFFDNLGKKLSQAGQGAVAKGKELADIAKLNMQVSEEEKKMIEAFQSIGQKYVELHAEDADAEFAELLTVIREAKAKIEVLKSQITEIKGVIRCVNCGAEVAKTAAFCSCCGTAMPKEPEVVEIEAVEVVEEKFCASCGTKLSADSAFCPECGTKAE